MFCSSLLRKLFLLLILNLSLSRADPYNGTYDIKFAPILTFAVSHKNPDVIYAGSRGCIFRIEKDNYTTIVGAENIDNSALAIDPEDAGKLYMIMPNSNVVLMTEDSGKTWNRLIIPEWITYSMLQHCFWKYTGVCVNPLNPKFIMIIGDASAKVFGEVQKDTFAAVLFTDDGGSTWNISTVLRKGWSYDRTAWALILSQSSPQICFIAGTKGIYRYREVPAKQKVVYDGLLEASPKNVTKFASDPTNPQAFLFATVDNEIFETSNGGDSFALLCKLEEKINCLAIDLKSSENFYIGTDNGILQTLDKGRTFKKIGGDSLEGLSVNCIYINPVNSIIYTGTDRGLFVSEDSGKSWHRYKSSKEIEAERLLRTADSLVVNGKHRQALEIYNKIINDFSMLSGATKAKEKIQEVELMLQKEKIAEIKKKLQRVSDEKVRSAIAKLGLDEYQSNAFANAIENLPEDAVARVMKDGLGMPLSDEECSAEYRKLTRFQKFYAVVCYLNSYEETMAKQEPGWEDAWYYGVVDKFRNISQDILAKLVTIKPATLLKK